jgi:ABC-2 type transport system permease protein
MTAPAAIRFVDLLAAELTKIRTLPATWVALAVAVVANALLGVLAATDVVRLAGSDGSAPIGQFGTLMMSPAYAFVSIAVFAGGSEYRGRQIRVSLTAVPRRTRLSAAKLAATLAVGLPAAVLVVVPGYLVQRAGHPPAGATIGDAARLVGVYLLLSLVGYGFAVLARSVVTPIAVLVILPVLVSPILRVAVPRVVEFLPHESALSFLAVFDQPAALCRSAGLAVLIAWTMVSVGAAWVLFVRRDS